MLATPQITYLYLPHVTVVARVTNCLKCILLSPTKCDTELLHGIRMAGAGAALGNPDGGRCEVALEMLFGRWCRGCWYCCVSSWPPTNACLMAKVMAQRYWAICFPALASIAIFGYSRQLSIPVHYLYLFMCLADFVPELFH